MPAAGCLLSSNWLSKDKTGKLHGTITTYIHTYIRSTERTAVICVGLTIVHVVGRTYEEYVNREMHGA